MKKIIVLAVICLSAMAVSAQNAEYASKVKEMLQLSGGEQTFHSAIDQMMTMIRQNNTGVPENVWTELETEFKKTSLDDLVGKLVPIYQKHLTISDLNGLIDFYQTPLGKKFAEKTPLITQESLQVGQQWGMEVGQRLMERLKEKGY